MSLIILTNTRPTLLLNDNPKRKGLKIQMQPSSIDGGNTGRIHIGRGFQPVATVNHAAQGEILIQGSYIDNPKGGEELDAAEKKAIWATSSIDNQSLTVEELLQE